MIKFLELTAPNSNEFRQVKIVSIEVNEGDQVAVGDTLFKVKSGKSEIDLPSTMAGRIAEIIALVDENISLLTPLVLLETEVAESTATPPISGDDSTIGKTAEKASGRKKAKRKAKRKQAKKPAAKKVPAKASKNSDQQSLDLNGSLSPEPDRSTSKTGDDGDMPDRSQADTQAPEEINESPAASETTDIQKSNAMSNIKVSVPDIGTDSAKVIEILVKVGDRVAAEDPLVTLESDKASMDVPSTAAGVVASIAVMVDQDVSEGALILELSAEDENALEASPEPAPEAEASAAAKPDEPAPADTGSDDKPIAGTVDVTIPDIGGDSAKVIEILVEPGQSVELEDPLVTLESDKASMEVPSSAAGTIESIEVKLDQDVTEGVVIVKVATTAKADSPTEPAARATSEEKQAPVEDRASSSPAADKAPASSAAAAPAGKSHASPSIRRFARELGVDLAKVGGTGRKGRVRKDDVKQFVKGVMSSAKSQPSAPSGESGIPQVPAVDFSRFGEIDVQPLNKIKRLTAANLHRSWLNVPHVTHNDESNISDLESFRKQLNAEYANQKKDIKLSPLAFIVKAVVNAMQAYPQFNSSLEPGGENLIYKKYFNIGIAVETPNGLVVPVVRDADKKSVAEIAQEMGILAGKARDKKLSPADMSGACFTISSLGGIGGTNFTPIVNAPEVAILGVSRGKMQPVWDGAEFKPAMILPLSLSYDHRVIDGAEAARFTRHIAVVLEDVRRLTI